MPQAITTNAVEARWCDASESSSIGPTALTELSGCHARGGPECPSECAVIIKPTGMGDLGHGLLTLLQPSGGCRQSGVGNQLAWGGSEKLLDEAGEADRRDARSLCQRSRAQLLIIVGLEVIQG